MAEQKPNILVLMPDQQRADCLSAAGHPLLRTPNMDRLCAEGTRFANAVTTHPICMPARAAFLNGLYTHCHHMWGNDGRMPESDETVFGLLRQAGYLTAHVGKSHLYEHVGQHMRLEEPYMHNRGFEYVHETTGPWATVTTRSYMTDEWERHGLYGAFKADYDKRRGIKGGGVWASPLPVDLHMDGYIGAQGERFIREVAGTDRPWALFVGFGGPHEPWDAPGEYATMHDPAAAPPPIPAADLPAWLPAATPRQMLDGGREPLDPAHVAALRANYYGKIALIDHWFGRIMAACRDRGFWDNTLAVFWSDHGEMAGDHGRLHKNVFYESSIRVPLVLRWPGRIAAGHVSRSPAQQIDVMPTLLEAAGARAGQFCQGVSLWPALDGSGTAVRDAAFSEVSGHAWDQRNYMIRTQQHKYAIDRHGRPFMLYDLQADPTEQVNLVGRPDARDTEAALRERLLAFLTGEQIRIPRAVKP